MDGISLLRFLAAAVALLGSPGPGIAALLAVTRSDGPRAGLRTLAGLTLGLAVVAGVTAAGLVSLLTALPALWRAASLASLAYLVVLAFRIGTAPVGAPAERAVLSARGGFWLGLTNPKAWLAFASLMASTRLLAADPPADAALKWALCLGVALAVDLGWIALGAALHRATLPPRVERLMNLALAVLILAAAALP